MCRPISRVARQDRSQEADAANGHGGAAFMGAARAIAVGELRGRSSKTEGCAMTSRASELCHWPLASLGDDLGPDHAQRRTFIRPSAIGQHRDLQKEPLRLAGTCLQRARRCSPPPSPFDAVTARSTLLGSHAELLAWRLHSPRCGSHSPPQHGASAASSPDPRPPAILLASHKPFFVIV